MRWAIIVLAIIVGLVVLDTGARLVLQWRVAVAAEEALPEGVTADVDARVGGFSAIWQLASGSLEHLELSTDNLSLLGVTVEVDVDAYGVSFGDGDVPVLQAEQVSGRLNVDETAINTIVPIPGAEGGITLGDDLVSYSTSMSFLGMELAVDIEATVGMQGDRLIIQATKLDLVGGSVDVDAASLLSDSTIAVPVCTAQYLPAGVHLTGIDVSPGEATVSVTTNQIALDQSALETRGTCR